VKKAVAGFPVRDVLARRIERALRVLKIVPVAAPEAAQATGGDLGVDPPFGSSE
jgi:hypothetical protein